jgi:diacylglycerol kinase family enzyme
MKVGVVFNPRSGRNARRPGTADRLARRLGDRGTVRTSDSLDTLHRIAEDFLYRDRVDVLAISGGDGTNHITLTAFLHVAAGAPLPPVAVLRGGTMNTLAESVGVRRRGQEWLLDRLVQATGSAGATPLARAERHVMRIDAGGRPPVYGFLFGTGVMHGFLAEYYRGGGNRPTPLTAVRTLARAVGSAMVGGPTIRRMAEPFRGTVTFADGTCWQGRDYVSVAAGTIAHIGLNFQPFHRYAERPGCFHALGLHAPPASLARELWRVYRGAPIRPHKADEAVTPSAVLSSTSAALPYMVDGDLYDASGDVSVSAGPPVTLLSIR